MTSIKYLGFKYLREIVIWQNLNTARYGFTEKGMPAPKHLPFKSSEAAEKAARSLAKQLKAVSCKESQAFTSDRTEFGYIPELEGFQVGDWLT